MTDAALIIYLIGLCYFAGMTIHGLDELHELRDDRGIGDEIIKVLGRRWGHAWIDLVGTLSILFWPLMMLSGIYMLVKRKR